MTTHLTRYEQFQRRIGVQLITSANRILASPQPGCSLPAVGVPFGQQLHHVLVSKWSVQRPFVVLSMVIVIELLVRARTYVKREPWPIGWLAIDNIRIGAVFSVVFEAFKLGS